MRQRIIELSKQGHHLLKIRHYSEARQTFEEALQLAPYDPYLMTGLGDALRQQKDFKNAAGYYRQVLEVDAHNPFALRGLGDALRGLQKYGEAIEFWKKYLQLKGFKDVFVLTRVADGYKTLSNHEESETYYKKALAIDANDRYALMGLADLYHKCGQEQPAIEYYEKALDNGVSLINILTIVANLHYRQKNFEKARLYYEKALARDPENSYALYGLGNCYRWKNDYQRSIELWERILKNNNGTANLLTRLGDAYRNLGQYEAAERSYKSNLDKGYDKFSLIGMVKLHSLQGRMREACDYYDELLNKEGEDRNVFADIGDLLIQNNQQALALQFFRHVLQRQKKCPAICEIIENRIKVLEGD